jgi:hypothetical protein
MQFLRAGWIRTEECVPALASTSPGDLRAIRLSPPGSTAYFVEFLSFPDPGQTEAKQWTPVEIDGGWYGLPSFRFMGLVEHSPRSTPHGFQYAASEMMSLANLLSHRTLGTDRIGKGVGSPLTYKTRGSGVTRLSPVTV